MKLDLLKRIRTYKGFSQKDIADEIQISEKAYNFKENGRTQFTRTELLGITQYLNLDLDQVNEIFFENNITKR